MPHAFRRVVVVLALPVLALFGLIFVCIRLVLRTVYGLWGWEFAWPPVLVDQLEAEADARQLAGSRTLLESQGELQVAVSQESVILRSIDRSSWQPQARHTSMTFGSYSSNSESNR